MVSQVTQGGVGLEECLEIIVVQYLEPFQNCQEKV